MVLKMDLHPHLHGVSIPNLNSGVMLSTSGLPSAPSKSLISMGEIIPCNSSTNNIPVASSNSGLSVSSSIAGFVVSDLLVPGRVTASGPVRQGAMTVQIEPWMLTGKVDVQQISVNVTSFGTLDLDKKSKEVWNQDVHWVRAIRLSDDCHTYNTQLKLQPSHRIYPNVRNGPLPKLILQVVRPIETGQELQLWFSEDLLAMLQVAFLSPLNIQGQKKYVCTRCSSLYESPNPLKLHITLACGKYPISTLWERLADLMKETQALQNVESKDDFNFKLNSQPQVCRQRNALDLTLGGQNSDNKGLYRPYTECSAFKPFRKQQAEINGNTPSLETTSRLQDIPPIWPVSLETDVVQLHRNLMHNQTLANAQNVYNDEAQIESLVSSLGKARQGHICLYCGKCYSRKYGLKIHIRTHTGYKPLRCKFCERPFGDPSNLNKHVRLHAEGNTPYKCDLCGKILVRRRDLERHLKSRHMLEMHPGNIIPDSPTKTEDASQNSTIENTEPNKEPTNCSNEIQLIAIAKNEDNLQVNEDEQDVKIIDIQKEDISDTDTMEETQNK